MIPALLAFLSRPRPRETGKYILTLALRPEPCGHCGTPTRGRYMTRDTHSEFVACTEPHASAQVPALPNGYELAPGRQKRVPEAGDYFL